MACSYDTTKADQVDTAGSKTSSPTLRGPSIHDVGNVRIGGQGPIFRNSEIQDRGKVRIGGQGPLFR